MRCGWSHESYPSHPYGIAPQHPAPDIQINVPVLDSDHRHLRSDLCRDSCGELESAMNRLQQDAAEVMAWHERQARHKQGYGPRPSEPVTRTWTAPPLTEQESRQHEQDENEFLLPF